MGGRTDGGQVPAVEAGGAGGGRQRHELGGHHLEARLLRPLRGHVGSQCRVCLHSSFSVLDECRFRCARHPLAQQLLVKCDAGGKGGATSSEVAPPQHGWDLEEKKRKLFSVHLFGGEASTKACPRPGLRR
jgi:hypothetical protein